MTTTGDEREFETANGERITEEEILDDLQRRGIARPIPKYDTAGDVCRADGCENIVPENDHKTMSFGLKDGYCGLACYLDSLDDDTDQEDSR